MEKKSNLLNLIKSKYILQNLLICAYGDIKSALKLIKYNKILLNRININIKDFYNYKFKNIIEKNGEDMLGGTFICDIPLIAIPYLIYIIMFYAKGTFNDNNLIEGYDKNKKNFVDFMNNYFLLSYLIFRIASNILTSSLFRCHLFNLKGLFKAIFFLFCMLLDLTHYIFYIIKFIYIRKLMKKELLKKLDKGKTSILTWFYSFDLALIVLMFVDIVYNLVKLSCFFIVHKQNNDNKELVLIELNGININYFKLPSEFNKLNEKSKNEIIFKTDNFEKYYCKLNESQINLIKKINDFREQNNIPKFKFDEYETLNNFIINPNLPIIFYKNENIYKITNNLYIFKYDKNEFQNILNNTEILNIIKIDFLDRIKVIEQNNNEFIYIYNNNIINKVKNKFNNNINIPKIYTKSHNIDIINTDDKLKDKFLGFSNEKIEDEISEKRIIIKKK